MFSEKTCGCGIALRMPWECTAELVLFGKFYYLGKRQWSEMVVWGVWNPAEKVGVFGLGKGKVLQE